MENISGDKPWLSILHPHFTPDIHLGHLVQAVVIVVTVGGGVLGGYLSLRADLEQQRAEFRVALAAHEARLTVAERHLDERRVEDREFQAEMRQQLQRLMQAVADLKTELVAGPQIAGLSRRVSEASCQEPVVAYLL